MKIIEILTDPSFVHWVQTGQDTKSEHWQAFVAMSSENRALAEEAKSILEKLSFEQDPSPIYLRQSIWKSVVNEKPLVHKKSISLLFFYRLTAAVIAFFILGGSIWLHVIQQRGTRLFSKLVTISTGYGETKQYMLPDSSIVWLNGNSTLQYATHWKNGQDRAIWIKGEAFFEVKHYVLQSDFVVHAGGLQIIATGTSFNVDTRKNILNIVLESGKLQINKYNGNRLTEMKPSDMLTYDSKAHRFKKYRVKPALYGTWRYGYVEFDHTYFSEVVAMMQNIYGYDVIVDDPALLWITVSGKTESVNRKAFLHTISDLFNVIIKQEQNVVTIYLKKRNKSN